MASDVHEAEIQELLGRHKVRYEVRPYYIVLEEHPVGAPPKEQRVQAGFEVTLYGEVEKTEFPRFQSEGARRVVEYFVKVAQEVQENGRGTCIVEVVPHVDSLVLDTHRHLQPETMLQIRISHGRGLDQPEGQPEEEALKAIREKLQELRVDPV